ncbi:protein DETOXIFICATION 42 [Ziziphus jujuba]|uniref:Protein DETOXIFICATION n=1 Tax=Ziziphus jujuba TaxID=326968 RepID=A0ABM3ZZP4_ZIZJJ|nr:protein DETOXIFICATION 42 [Ziziphus jujuba]XP_060669961.1 protein DETOXIFICATION 42 [Ziziphus jujuba]
MPLGVFFRDARLVFKLDSLGKEILRIAFPAALAVAADPIASLIDTAFIGHLGPVELAAAGVSIALFNQASRITIFPLVSITTSFVAEEDTIAQIKINAEKSDNLEKSSDFKSGELNHLDLDIEKGAAKPKGDNLVTSNTNGENLEKSLSESSKKLELKVVEKESKAENTEKDADENANSKDLEAGNDSNASALQKVPNSVNSSNKKNAEINKGRRHIASASTALIFGTILGLVQAIFLVFGAKTLLGVMGVKSDSPMLAPAQKYLVTRSFGAPAVLLTLAMQGIFRGFKDTTTPLYVILFGYAINIALDPLLIFVLHMGIRGAAIAHVFSQYLMALILFLMLMRKVDLVPPSLKYLQFGRFLRNGSLLLARVIAVTFCVTLAASLAARLGSTPMAAFQTCLQVWLTSSLLADGLAVAVQAILACAFAEKDYKKATAAATRVLQMSFVLGIGLALVVGVGLYFGAGIFSRDVNVLHLIRIGLPFVAATQPINSLSFVFDGVNFGASDFAYSAYSLVLVAIASIVSLFLMCRSEGFVGIWIALTIYMGLRTLAGVWRMGTGTGPWRFLRVPFSA